MNRLYIMAAFLALALSGCCGLTSPEQNEKFSKSFTFTPPSGMEKNGDVYVGGETAIS